MMRMVPPSGDLRPRYEQGHLPISQASRDLLGLKLAETDWNCLSRVPYDTENPSQPCMSDDDLDVGSSDLVFE
jgi:hypothetical protein